MKAQAGRNVAVVGATGLVGKTIAALLEEREFPVGEFIPVATESSSGREVEAFGRTWLVKNMDTVDFGPIDYGFFTAGRAVSLEHVPHALEKGCRVIDNTTAYRMSADVPLVVPEINGGLISSATRLVSSPNCTAIILTMALAPLHRAVSIKRVIATSFQSVSGTGREAMEELMAQTRAMVDGGRVKAKVYPKPIAFNCLPKIGELNMEGCSGEEEKVIQETKKILSATRLEVAPTTVRVPVQVGHALSVNVEFEEDLSTEKAQKLLDQASGVEVDHGLPTPLDVAGRDEVVVGRLRRDGTRAHAIAFWVVGDNLRKGAATNSVQIAELMEKQR